jgi:hypothetical protein
MSICHRYHASQLDVHYFGNSVMALYIFCSLDGLISESYNRRSLTSHFHNHNTSHFIQCSRL